MASSCSWPCRLNSLSRRECAPAVVCSVECEPQEVFEGDVKGGPGCEPGKVLCGRHLSQLLTYLSRQQVTGMAFLNACTHGPYWSLCGASPASTSIYSPCAALLSAPPPITSPSVFKEPFRGDRRSAHPVAALFAAMGEVWLSRTLKVKSNRTYRIEFVVM